MTNDELQIYRLKARVLLLERLSYQMLFGLLVGRGATVEQARSELLRVLERDEIEIQPELPKLAQGDAALNALLLEEFRELVADLKSLIASLD